MMKSILLSVLLLSIPASALAAESSEKQSTEAEKCVGLEKSKFKECMKNVGRGAKAEFNKAKDATVRTFKNWDHEKVKGNVKSEFNEFKGIVKDTVNDNELVKKAKKKSED